MTTPSEMLTKQLLAANELLGELARIWPAESVHVAKSKPLWQDAIRHVSPEWSVVLGGAVSWLDHASVMLIKASAASSVEVNMRAYQDLAAELEAFVSGEAIVKPKGLKQKIQGVANALPEEKIAELFEKKEGLNRVSAPRIELLQQAIDFSEIVRQLSALCLEVIPHLIERCASEIALAEVGADAGLFEDQTRMRNIRKTERAMQSLNIASQRLRAEFEPGKVAVTNDLEKSIRAEEDYHARIETLIGAAKNKIATDKLVSGERAYTQHLDSLVAHQAVDSAAKQLTVIQTPARMPALFSMFTRAKDAAPGKLLEETKTALRLIVKNVENSNKLWAAFAKAMEDPNLRPNTPMSGSYMSFRSKKAPALIDFISNQLYVDHNPDGKYELVNALIARHPGPLDHDTFNWAGIQKAALRAAGSSTLDTMFETWKLLGLTSRFVPLENPVDLIVIANSNYFASSKSWPEEKASKLLEITASVMNTHVSIKHFDDFFNRVGVSGSLLPLSPYLKKDVADFIAYRVLIESMKINLSPLDHDVQLMGRLSSAHHQALAHKIIENPMPKWAAALSGHEGVKAILSSPPSADTKWAFALNDFARLFSTDKGNIPRDLLEHVINTRNDRVLAYIQDAYQDHTLPPAKTSIVEARDRAMFQVLLERELHKSRHTDDRAQKPNPQYWCHIFSAHVSADLDCRDLEIKQENANGRGLEKDWENLENHWEDYRSIEFGGTAPRQKSVYPMMLACVHGNLEWVKALLDAGAQHHADRSLLAYELSRGVFTRALVGGVKVSLTKAELLDNALKKLSFKQRRICIREVVHAMDQTGLWDIKSASMGAFHIEMTAVALYKDVCDLPGRDKKKRVEAIKEMVKNMTTDHFIETLSHLGGESGFDVDEKMKLAILQYGAIVGITSSKKLGKAIGAAKGLIQSRLNIEEDFEKSLRSLRFGKI